MVICIIALPVLALMGLFSLRYRMLAGEAFRCLFRTVVFKPCDTGLDKRIKMKFTAKLMWWPLLARGFYKSFEVLSWVFVILLVLSVVGTGYGVYNYIVYGNCNGPDDSSFCIFNVVHKDQPTCSAFGAEGAINASKIKDTGYPVRGENSAVVTIHEFGCYGCPYTREAQPVVRQILGNYSSAKLVFHDLPLEIHPFSIEAGKAALCAGRQGEYWGYHDALFEQENLSEEALVSIANSLELDMVKFGRCYSSDETADEIKMLESEAKEIGIYGTPTFIIGDRVLVGPQTYGDLKKAVERVLKTYSLKTSPSFNY